MSEVTLPRNSPRSTTVSSSVEQRPSVLTQAPREPYFTATESAEHVRRVSPSIHADESHPLATGTLTLSNNNLSRNNSGSSSSSGSSTNRGSSSLNSEVRRFFRGPTSLVSSNSPLRDRRARQQSPQSYSHHQHNTLYHITNIDNNNNTVHRSSSSSGNTTNNVESRSRTHASHPPTAPSSNRRSKYPMALPTEINQVYDGPVRGTAIIDSNYILDSSPVFEMITTPMSTHRLKKRLSSDVAMRSNSNSLCDNPVTATTSSSDNNNNPDEDDENEDEEKEAAGSDGNINSTSQECNSYMNSKNNSKIDKGTNTKREGEQECNLQVSLFESLPSKCTNEENSSPIIIQADNTGRLYRSNSSRLSMHGSFRMMKGSTTTSSSNNNNNNENSPETSFVNKSLPSVVCTSKACETSSNNNPIHVATNNVNNENASITYTVPNEHQEGAAATNINSNNNNVNSNTNLEHSREQQRHDGTNLFSLHHNNEGSTNVLESTATNHEANDLSTHIDNTSNNTNENNNRGEVDNLVEREHVNEQSNQQEEQRQGNNDVNSTNRNNNNNDDDNVLPMTRFEEEPQAMPETGNNNNNNTSNDVNSSQRMTNENAVDDTIVEANEPLTDNNTSTRDTLPSCPCRERIEPLQVLNGDYVLFSDSFIESDPSSIVAVMTHEFKQTCVRCNTMPNKVTNAERTRLQAVREVLAEAEVECRPLFRRVPSEIVYGSAEYLPESDNAKAERSMHAIVEDHEVPIQEEQTEESTTTNNINIETHQNKKNVEKTVLKKATNNKNKNNISKLSEHNKKTNSANTNGDCLTIRQITEELEQNTPRI